MKKERLLPVVRCHGVETVQSQYCGWQSCLGVTRILKFRELYVIKRPACRNAVKTGVLIVNNVKCNFTLGVATSFATHLQGSLDNANWCTGETYQTGREELSYQTTTAVYEVLVFNQWAKANEVAGMLTMILG